MDTVVIDVALLKEMFLSGAANLENNKEWINELNVFPVPDGDTGTNMTLTIQSAVKEVNALEDLNMKKLQKAMSSGSLRGARGNSGVILSQLFRGFCKTIADQTELDIPVLAKAMVKAKETAYKAVMKPKEGTILTVAKGMADKALEVAEKIENGEMECTLSEYIEIVLAYGKEVLNQTPEMLPVLKEAGVVDSGGQGLICIIEGAVSAFNGKPITTADPSEVKKLKYLYCTELKILTKEPVNRAEAMNIKSFLSEIGEEAVVANSEKDVVLRVHTNEPDEVIKKALTYGQITEVKIENMNFEHNEIEIHEEEVLPAKPAEPPKKYGSIAVSIGAGMDEIFRGLNVDHLISGGQTMNPSTEDMLDAISKVNAENIFILPNNKNIILAAEQAASLTKDKNIIVLPSKTVCQGIAAMIGFMAEAEIEENKEAMIEGMSAVKTGQVTYAVRNTSIDGKVIHEGDFMGIDDNGISAVGTDLAATVLELIDNMVDDDSELISIYYGADTKAEDAEAVKAMVEEKFSDLDIEMYQGDQPVYYYLISVE